MNQAKADEFQLRMDGVAEGIKFATAQTLKWVLEEMAREEALKQQTGEKTNG